MAEKLVRGKMEAEVSIWLLALHLETNYTTKMSLHDLGILANLMKKGGGGGRCFPKERGKA